MEYGGIPFPECSRGFLPLADGIDLTFSGGENLVVQTDRNYLQVIMQNLTANAVKALKDKPIWEIAWKAWQEQGNTYLSITDNGPGVREE